MKIEQQVHPGSIIYLVVHTVGQIYSSEKNIYSISLHVALVSDL